jgi:hypothetical protein
MVDIFALALSHGLLLLAAWRLVLRPDLDVEAPGPASEPVPAPVAPRRGANRVMKTGRRDSDDTADEEAAGGDA